MRSRILAAALAILALLILWIWLRHRVEPSPLSPAPALEASRSTRAQPHPPGERARQSDAAVDVASPIAPPAPAAKIGSIAGGHVVDADGNPVVGATVTVRAGLDVTATTDERGDFVLHRSTDAPSAGVWGWYDVAKSGFATAHVGVELVADDGTPLPRVVLQRPMCVEGIVVDQDGQPVTGAHVQLSRADEVALQLPGEGATSADGRFAFPEASTGTWVLRVSPPPGPMPRWRCPEGTPVQAGTRDIVVRLVRLREGATKVCVDLTDADTGQPMDAMAASIVDAPPSDLRGGSSPLPSPRLERGCVTVEPVGPGDYAVWLQFSGRPTHLVRLHVAEGDREVRAACRVLRQGRTITGHIRPTSALDAQLLVTCYPADGVPTVGGVGLSGYCRVGADGAFRIEGLAPVRMFVHVAQAGWLGEAVVDASSNDADVDIPVDRVALVRFRGAGPTSARYVRIEGAVDDGPWTTMASLGLNASSAIQCDQSVHPGRLRWRVVFRKSASIDDLVDVAEPQSGEVTLVPGQTIEVNIPIVGR